MDKILSDIFILNQKLNKFKYGIPINGRIDQNKELDGNDYINKYKPLTPFQFLFYNGGICWDYTRYEAYYIKKHFPEIKFKTWYVTLTDKLQNFPSHTFLTFQYNNKYYYIESSFKYITGIYVADNEYNIFNFVLSSMNKYTKNCQWDIIPHNKYGVFDIDILNKNTLKMNMIEFEKWATQSKFEIPHKYNYIYDIRQINDIEYFDIDVLYHGSHENITGTIIPKISTHKMPYIYATSYYSFALCYAGNQWSDLDINQCIYNRKLCLTEMYKGAFEKIFNTYGYIYKVPSTEFKSLMIKKDISMKESISLKPVKPIEKIFIENVLKELKKNSIKLFYYPNLPPYIKSRDEYLKQKKEQFGIK